MFHRTEIRTETANVAKGNVEKVRGAIKTCFRVVTTDGAIPRGTFGSPPQKGTPKLVYFYHLIILLNFDGRVYMYRVHVV